MSARRTSIRPLLRIRKAAAGLSLLATMLAAGPAAARPLPDDASPAPLAAPRVFPFGVAWYPEWVPEARWDADLAAMRRANITYVRIAEFAWSNLEPEEGRYEFGWLERAIERARAHGLRVLLGTPTAAPPAWLTSRYPDTLLVEATGQRAEHGGRRHFSVSSPRYREHAARIAGEFGRRFGKNPAVIGFQIDNEYGRDTYDQQIKANFQAWLKARYGSLDKLNTAWFNVYWSRTISDWGQIGIPDEKYGNPAARIDWLRFFSDEWRAYQQVQIAALRPHLGPGQIITTNFVAKYDDFDFSVPAQDLDIVGWDQYHEQPRLDPAESGLQHDLYRGFLGRAPWILEATPQNIVYSDRNFTPPKGELRAKVWQAVAHGADSYSFWLWQTPPGGNEPLHGAIVDTLGRPKLTYAEIAQTGGEIGKAWSAIRDTVPVAQAAFLHDYPNRWLAKRDRLTTDLDPWDVLVRAYRAAAPAVGGIDVLQAPERLDRYKVVVAPLLTMVDDKSAAALAVYVQGGGHLVLGPRAGSRTTTTGVREPGAFEALLGARADAIQVPSSPVALAGSLGSATASILAERLVITQPDVETLLRYGKADGWLDGAPAVVSRKVGKGRVTYVGALLDDAGLASVMRWAAGHANAAPAWPNAPEGVEVIARRAAKRSVIVAMNWSGKPQQLVAPQPMTDLIGGGKLREISLEPFGVAVLEARP